MKQGDWIHFIGIAGVATGQLAVEMHSRGFFVSGSDKGLYPPMSDYIKSKGLEIELGYKPEHLDIQYYKAKYNNHWSNLNRTKPGFVVYQSAKGAKNPELMKAAELQIPLLNFTDILKDWVILQDESIVVAGTYGKTTTTAMVAWILNEAGIEISHMIGALANNFENGVKFKTENTKYSVVEGDEYIVSHERMTSKFFEYSPKYLVLTGISWDHADIFATENDYINNFKKLLEQIPDNGTIIYNQYDENVQKIIGSAKCKRIEYLIDQKTIDKIELKLIGSYNKVNAIAAFTLCKELGIDETTILKALNSFSGIKRRMEIKYHSKHTVVIDDFGASPSKAKAAIESINNEFPKFTIHAIFEPNMGSRTKEVIEEYATAFTPPLNIHGEHDDIIVYLPRFTAAQSNYFENNELENYLKEKNVNTLANDNDDDLIQNVINNLTGKDIIIFLGSHGFRGMIEKIIHKLQLIGK